MDVVKAQEEVCNRAFSAARVTHKGNLLRSWDGHIEIVEDEGFSTRIAEVNIFKFDFSFTDCLNFFSRALSYI